MRVEGEDMQDISVNNDSNVKPISVNKDNRLLISYLLWLVGWAGIPGMHRLYNGKIGTGLLWLFTFGLFGIGQLIDLFLVPNMAEEQRLKLLARSGLSSAGAYPSAPINAQVVAPLTSEQMMVKVLKAAQKHGGQLSVTQAVMETGLGFSTVEDVLREMLRLGYVSIDNHPTTGIIIYRFHEL